MLSGRYAYQPILFGAFFGLTSLVPMMPTAEAQEAGRFDNFGWQFRPHAGLDLDVGSLGTGDTSLDEEGEFDYALGYGARVGAKLGRFGLEGRYWYTEPDADLPVFVGNTFIGQFPASTEFGILSVHGSFDVYRGDHLEVYVSGGYGEGTLEFEFDDPAIVEFNDGEIDVEAWFGEIGVAVEVTTHLQVVPHVQVFAWELQEDGDQIDGTETLIASLAGITVRGIW